MKTISYILLLTSLLGIGCKKMLEIDSPENQLTTNKVFADSTSAIAALANIYAQFDKNIEVNLTRNLGLYTDELDFTATTQQQIDFWSSSVPTDNSANLNIWKNFYQVVYGCNDLIENLNNSYFTASTKSKLINEAKFLRAYSYYYLVALYGKIPLILTTDVNVNRLANQVDQTAVYAQIISDLLAAKQNLPASIGAGKARANKWAASAMLARAYLLQKNWAAAEKEANEVINCGLYVTAAVENVFKANSKETILQFWTQEGYIASAPSLLPPSNTLPTNPITSQLILSFENVDYRKNNWIGTSIIGGHNYYYPNKYKNRAVNTTSPEYLIALRLSEQYLIRAETRAQLGNIIDASNDLDVIRMRAGLNGTSATTQSELLLAIEQERKVELFAEWGSRFIDLKRIGKINSAMSSYKSTWKTYAEMLPIPQSELIYNKNFTQNIGYN